MKNLILALLTILPPTAGAIDGRQGDTSKALGRVFFTPEQRLALERPSESEAERQSLRLEGVVQRDGTARSFWLNGQLQHGRAAAPGIDIRFPGPSRARAQIPDRPLTPLAVGDAIDIVTGERQPLLPEHSIRIRPARRRDAP